MKKVIYLYGLMCSLTTFAQSIANKDILGTWKVSVITTPELSVDMQTLEVTLAPETVEWAKKRTKVLMALKKMPLKTPSLMLILPMPFRVKGYIPSKSKEATLLKPNMS